MRPRLSPYFAELGAGSGVKNQDLTPGGSGKFLEKFAQAEKEKIQEELAIIVFISLRFAYFSHVLMALRITRGYGVLAYPRHGFCRPLRGLHPPQRAT